MKNMFHNLMNVREGSKAEFAMVVTFSIIFWGVFFWAVLTSYPV